MKADELTRRCSAVNAKGKQCGSHAVRDGSEPPLCWYHKLTPEERLEQSKRGGQSRAAQRQEAHELKEHKPRADFHPGITLSKVLEVCAPAMVSVIEATGEPDWSARLAAAGVVLMTFPRYLRSTPEDVRELLERALPEQVIEQPGMRERLEAETVYRALRAEWFSMPRYSPIRGLYARPLPKHLVAPWESYEAVVAAETPADIPPELSGVTMLPDGRALLSGVVIDSDLAPVREELPHALT